MHSDDGEREMDEEEASPRGSPQAHRRRATNITRNDIIYKENSDRAFSSDKAKSREESGNGSVNVDERNFEATRRVSSTGSSDGLGDMNGGPGVVRGYSTSGRSDSLTRGMKPSYGGYQLRRHGSSESMSSQSTLVNRTGYVAEDDTQQSIIDLIGMGHSGLTRSQINAHMKSEARKQRHNYHGGGGGGVRGGAGSRVSDMGGEERGNGGGGERAMYYHRLHPELQYPYDEKMGTRQRSSRRRREEHGPDTPDDDEGTLHVHVYMLHVYM